MVLTFARNLNVRPDSSLWHNRDNSVLLGSCESKQGQGGKLGHGGMWKIPWIQLSSWGNNITWSSWDQNPPPPTTNMLNGLTTSFLYSWGIKISHPLWTIRWLRDINSGQTSRLQRTCFEHHSPRCCFKNGIIMDWNDIKNGIIME